MRHKNKEKHFRKTGTSNWQTLTVSIITFLICLAAIISLTGRRGNHHPQEAGTSTYSGKEDAQSGTDGTGDSDEKIPSAKKTEKKNEDAGKVPAAPGAPEITEDFLEPNKYSRSRKKLKKVNGIVVHFVDNPGSTAKQNRDFFNNLAKTHVRKASSHYIIGLEGEIIQCIPRGEIAYASKERNKDTISIECCHENSSGKFNKKTKKSLVNLAEWLCRTYDLTEKQVIRHYDVTGKMCPRYYVEHPGAWKKLRAGIKKKIKKNREKYK